MRDEISVQGPENVLARKFPPETYLSLAHARSHQDFLCSYFEETKISYAEVARRAGFSSRSYPRDVTERRRRLTAKSLPTLMRGLRLGKELNAVFQLLYFVAYPDEYPEAITLAAIEAKLAKARALAERKLRAPVRKKSLPPEMQVCEEAEVNSLACGLSDVVAALGELKAGATVDAIQKRTGLGKTFLAEKLDLLVRHGIVEYRGDARRYFSRAEHVDWTGQAGNRLAEASFRNSVERLGRVAEQHFSRPETMLINSAVSIGRKDLPRFKQELRELILRFVDRSVASSPEQDTVVQLVAGMFEARLAPPVS